MAEVYGVCDEKFAGVRDLLSASIDRGDDVGASFALMSKGKWS